MASCSAGGGDTPGGDGDQTEGDGDGDIDLGSGGNGTDTDIDLREEPTPVTCDNGQVDVEEACDDGNTVSGDGCYENCRFVEPGFICPRPGQPCIPFAKCGDGAVQFPEQCDDGNDVPLDGCSELCKIEIGSKCSGEPSVCEDTTCGDGIAEGAEGCDDGNPVPFDGCDAACQWEPSCGEPGSEDGCSSFCGDGILLGDEVCDDGNSTSGDGCSAECTVEDGYTCNTAPCDMVNGQCVLKIPAVYRDFLDSHANFACGGGDVTPGFVESELDADGKPLHTGLTGQCMSASDNVNSWYRDGADHSTFVGEIVLFDNGNGGFVNRFGPNGEPYENAVGALIDGTPLFFPLDVAPLCEAGELFGCALSDTTHYASIPGEPHYEPGTWIDETPAVPHNFSFTTEVSYWFEYNAAAPPTLDFLGDDDVWVFVNGKLAVDLGGLHVPLARTLTLDGATNTDLGLGLATGNVYPISVFHAERNPRGSSFRLTLSGFRAERSVCLPTCGDGVVAGNEECDDGENLGGHNECQPGCVLATYCGDGQVQPSEQCDDNAPDAPANCSGCRLIVVH